METKGQRIRKLRKALKLTQKDLGILVGVSAPTVTLWEKDETSPKGDNADTLVKVLNTNWDYLKSGKNPENTEHKVSETHAPYYAVKNEPTPLYSRDLLTARLTNSSDPEPIKNVSSIAIPEKLRSNNVFAMIEDMDGLAPLINIQDYVFISPNLSLKPDTKSMFLVDGMPLIGLVAKTPSGLMLKFISDAQGWEPKQVNESDYIGRVIAIDPVWAREQRD